MKPKHQRLVFYAFALMACGIAVALLLTALEDYIVYFHSPSDLADAPPDASSFIRVGGMVQEGSVLRTGNNATFVLTDFAHNVTVRHNGVLPALFREGQGIVAEGYYRDGAFEAETILAKHDEYYMPPEVAKTLTSDDWKARAAESLAQ